MKGCWAILRKALVVTLTLTAVFIIFVCTISDSLPDMGVESLNDTIGIIKDRSRISRLITKVYRDSGVYISIYVDHMVDKKEASDTINVLAESAYYPEDCLFIIYFDNGITYEYYYAPGGEVVKQLSGEALKAIFDTTAEAYDAVGGEEVLYRTLKKIQQSLGMA